MKQEQLKCFLVRTELKVHHSRQKVRQVGSFKGYFRLIGNNWFQELKYKAAVQQNWHNK